jgi:hypothetical protein
MKSIHVAAIWFAIIATALAETQQIPAGKYILITDEEDLRARPCEISNEKDGAFVIFPVNDKYPEQALKPLRITFLGNREFQFTVGPSDYSDSKMLEHAASGIHLYLGSNDGTSIMGVTTSVMGAGEPKKGRFILYKQ